MNYHFIKKIKLDTNYYIMKNYIKFINENENKNNQNILVIVDFQKEFEKFIPLGMLENLINFCNNFNSVYQIWDSNKADDPSYIFPNQKEAIIKKFGTKFSDNLEETVKELDAKYPNAKEGDMFEFDDINSYVIRVKNKHKWFYITENLANLFKKLKGKKVTLVGGAYRECLLDVFEAMESFEINVVYDKRFIYSAKNNNKQQHNLKTQSYSL